MKQSDVRPLISAAKAKSLIKMMKSKAEVDDSLDTKARVRLYEEKLRSGDADAYTEVLCELSFRKVTDKISGGEQRLLDSARNYFVSEVGAVLKLSNEKVLAAIQMTLPDDDDD
jgi:RNA polymerase-interacting CarD/CdnL/TRCF family regulator